MISRAFLTAFILAASYPALAQDEIHYRSGVPDVLSPSKPSASLLEKTFAKQYRAKNSPRIAIYWMQPLPASDTSNTTSVEISNFSAISRSNSHSAHGSTSITDSHSVVAGSYQRIEVKPPVQPAADLGTLSLSESRLTHSLFIETFTRAGAKIVAPAATLSSLKSTAEIAIVVHGILLGQVSNAQHYRIDIHNIKKNEIISSIVADGFTRSEANADFITSPNGGYVELAGSALGRELAWKTFEALSRARW